MARVLNDLRVMQAYLLVGVLVAPLGFAYVRRVCVADHLARKLMAVLFNLQYCGLFYCSLIWWLNGTISKAAIARKVKVGTTIVRAIPASM